MFRRTVVATLTATFLAVLAIGCGGSEAQPVLKNNNAATFKKDAQKSKPSVDD
jgi:hypothetical protein